MKLLLPIFTLLLLSTIGNSQIMLDSTLIEERVVLENLNVPWDMTYGPDGWIWFTEVAGGIHRFHPDTEVHQEIFTIEDVETFGFSAGLHSIVLDPNFNENHFLYVHYLNSETTSKIVRYSYDEANSTLIDPVILLGDIIGSYSHNGSRMLILDGKLMISIGDGYENPDLAQGFDTNNGKFLRMNLDGSIPDDNPIAGSYIWSWGHRNQQGFCIGNGILYSSEHGTSSDDEINIIKENRNYGWPNVEGNCDTPAELEFCETNNVVTPIWTWTPAIAPCGMDYFNHSSIPEWKNSLIVATLKGTRFIQLKLSEDGESIVEENNFFVQQHGRLRDVLVIPDGRIYICSSNRDYAGVFFSGDDEMFELKGTYVVGVDKVEESKELEIYPNPAKDYFSFDLSDNIKGKFQLEVYDIKGVLIHQKQFSNQAQFTLSTASFSNGLYLLQLKGADQTYVGKIMIQH